MNNGNGAWRSSYLRVFESWKPTLDDTRRSWTVCPHLSRPEELFDYYIDSGSIMILLGKVLCHECYEIITSSNDLSEYINVSKHMTDHRFHNDFLNPLIMINKEYLFSKSLDRERHDWSWICCPHITRNDQLEALYSTCNPMFVHEGFVTCNDCLETIPSTTDFIRASLGCDALTDSQLQEKFINQLYRVNREVLEAVGHFSR